LSGGHKLILKNSTLRGFTHFVISHRHFILQQTRKKSKTIPI